MSYGHDEWYAVYNPSFDVAAFDPLDPAKRYHEGIFIEVNPDNLKGTMFHVTGDIIAAGGMYYQEKTNYAALKSTHLHKYPQIGWSQVSWNIIHS